MRNWGVRGLMCIWRSVAGSCLESKRNVLSTTLSTSHLADSGGDDHPASAVITGASSHAEEKGGIRAEGQPPPPLPLPAPSTVASSSVGASSNRPPTRRGSGSTVGAVTPRYSQASFGFGGGAEEGAGEERGSGHRLEKSSDHRGGREVWDVDTEKDQGGTGDPLAVGDSDRLDSLRAGTADGGYDRDDDDNPDEPEASSSRRRLVADGQAGKKAPPQRWTPRLTTSRSSGSGEGESGGVGASSSSSQAFREKWGKLFG